MTRSYMENRGMEENKNLLSSPRRPEHLWSDHATSVHVNLRAPSNQKVPLCKLKINENEL